MPETTAADVQKQQIAVNFDAIAATYDELRFLQRCADRLLELVAPHDGARVLDIGTGTGIVAIGAARIVGPGGRVAGVDISRQMLARARHKLAQAGLTQVELHEGDAEHLDFPDHSFDVVLCASSLCFFPDTQAMLHECRRVLVPGGCLGFSTFGKTFLQPLWDLLAARLRKHGVAVQAPAMYRLPNPETCKQLLRDAGFTGIDVRDEQLGYYIPSGVERWKDICAGLEGIPLLRLSTRQRKQVMTEHLEELAAHATSLGIWVDVPTNFAFGHTAAL